MCHEIPFRSSSSGRAGFKHLRQRRVKRRRHCSDDELRSLGADDLAERERRRDGEARSQIISPPSRYTCVENTDTTHARACVRARARERRHVRFLVATCGKSIVQTAVYSRKFRGDPSFLKLVASIICLPLSRRRVSKDDEATNNQHFPISVNLARSFNGKRRRCRRSAFPRE